MEGVISAEGTEEAKFDDISTSSGLPPSPPDNNADPVVYKLVRVDGDGRLVPATDDEVKEVAGLLKDDKSEMHPSENAGQTVGSVNTDGFSSGKYPVEASEGLLKPEQLEVYEETSNAQLDTAVDWRKSNAHYEEAVPSLAAMARGDNGIDQIGSVGESSYLSDGVVKNESTSAACRTSKPDFTMLKGEICLDNLSVKELHETFKAAFGRETSVKDKQWLKRRIAMGLTNSCDVSTTTFVTKDNKLVKKRKEEILNDLVGTLSKETLIGALNEHSGGLPIAWNNQIENSQNIFGKRSMNLSSDSNHGSEDLHAERTTKRIRKPTRRYIEELSEAKSGEHNGKLISSIEKSGQDIPSRSCVKSVWDGRPVITRWDSIGGSGVRVPYVCRVRRGRPRENFMALMKLEHGSMSMAAKMVKKALGMHDPEPDKNARNKILEAKLTPGWIQKPLITEVQKDTEYLVRKASELEVDIERKQLDPFGDNSDDYTVTLPTAKGGTRRKHHRPWTLSEVVNLVEGVAKYGAGRWSEIKRLVFASFPYRTSVDLKDKWRNLLKASFQYPVEKGMQNSRKQASVPIPAPILSRVRELAEKQEQAIPPSLSSSKLVAYTSTKVHEIRSGYL